MNNCENYTNPGARRVPDQELLRELMPKLGLEAAEPKSRYKNRLRLRLILPKALALCALAAVLLLLGLYAFTPAQVRGIQLSESLDRVEVAFGVDKAPLLENVTARLDGTPVTVRQDAMGSYRIDLDRNGELDISVSTLTGRQSQTRVTVDAIDDEPPHVSRHELTDGQMTIYFTDNDGAGIDWQTLRATEIATGDSFDIPQIDEQNDMIRFPFPAGSIRITMADRNGNPLAVALEPVPDGEME